LLREPGSGTRATTLALIHDLGISPPTLSLGSHGAVIASASLGLGVTVASTDAVARQVALGELEHRSAPGTPLRRPWHLLTTGTPTAATRLFIQHVTSANAGALAFRARSARRRTPSPTAT
jgi:DNA-binding transcriptional LysR family regulator